MVISEFIRLLETVKKENGDVKVQVGKYDGSLMDLQSQGVLAVQWPEDRKTVFITRS